MDSEHEESMARVMGAINEINQILRDDPPDENDRFTEIAWTPGDPITGLLQNIHCIIIKYLRKMETKHLIAGIYSDLVKQFNNSKNDGRPRCPMCNQFMNVGCENRFRTRMATKRDRLMLSEVDAQFVTLWDAAMCIEDVLRPRSLE